MYQHQQQQQGSLHGGPRDQCLSNCSSVLWSHCLQRMKNAKYMHAYALLLHAMIGCNLQQAILICPVMAQVPYDCILLAVTVASPGPEHSVCYIAVPYMP